MYIEILEPKVDHSKLAELDHMIKGTTSTKAASSLSLSNNQLRANTSDLKEYAFKQAELHQQRLSTKGASIILDGERRAKLNELGKVIREYFG